MNILKSGGTLFLAYEGRMGRATEISPRLSVIFSVYNVKIISFLQFQYTG